MTYIQEKRKMLKLYKKYGIYYYISGIASSFLLIAQHLPLPVTSNEDGFAVCTYLFCIILCMLIMHSEKAIENEIEIYEMGVKKQ